MKAILVIDLPVCFGFPFEDIKTKVILYAKDKDNLEYSLYLKYNNEIKLKPMPPYKLTDLEKTTDYSCGWEHGYNACIDEILGKEIKEEKENE